jgi:polyhydroxybutyrate depolymerase
VVQPNRARFPRLKGGRLRFLPPEYFDRLMIDVDGIRRTYWIPSEPPAGAPGSIGPTPPAASGDGVGAGSGEPPPLLIALHGYNSSGSRLAWWSGLDKRGPPAGFRCVFPDALKTIWDDHGCGRRDGADDPAFIARLIDHLGQTGAADPNRVVLTGVSSGATFAERLVRTGAISVKGMALVVGTARVASRDVTPIAGPATDVLLVAGTGDPILPYEGGAARGPVARLAMKGVDQMLLDPSGHESVAPETLMADWVAANVCAMTPSVEALPPTDENFAVDRLRWASAAGGDPAVTLYRIAGGGHGWPSARQYLPARMLGRIPQGFDATGIVLEFARAVVSRPDR